MSGIHAEPAKLTPRFFAYIWGGTLLRDCLNKPIPSDDIGESWEVSAHPRGQSTVATGPAAGMAFGDWASGPEFYGCMQAEKFPLLIKLLGARDNLSVQVHPADDNCGPKESGKAEAWAVVACKPGSELIYGINCPEAEFAEAVEAGRMEEKLNRLKVAPGDVLDIPAGVVHALTAGIVVYEVQQNSDTTYRLYDWGRVDAKTGMPRELHVDAALRVIRRGGGEPVAGTVFREGGCTRTAYINNPRFTLEKLEIDGAFKDIWFDNFAAYTVVEGGGKVLHNGTKCFEVSLGDSFVSPAAAGAPEMRGRMTLLKSHVPPPEAYMKWLARG